MTRDRTGREIPDEAHIIADRLAMACRTAGLSADALSPTRVRACVPHAHARLTEIITIMPDENEVLSLFWSWGERIGPATDIDRAVLVIKHVVTPPVHSVS